MSLSRHVNTLHSVASGDRAGLDPVGRGGFALSGLRFHGAAGEGLMPATEFPRAWEQPPAFISQDTAPEHRVSGLKISRW